MATQNDPTDWNNLSQGIQNGWNNLQTGLNTQWNQYAQGLGYPGQAPSGQGGQGGFANMQGPAGQGGSQPLSGGSSYSGGYQGAAAPTSGTQNFSNLMNGGALGASADSTGYYSPQDTGLAATATAGTKQGQTSATLNGQTMFSAPIQIPTVDMNSYLNALGQDYPQYQQAAQQQQAWQQQGLNATQANAAMISNVGGNLMDTYDAASGGLMQRQQQATQGIDQAMRMAQGLGPQAQQRANQMGGYLSTREALQNSQLTDLTANQIEKSRQSLDAQYAQQEQQLRMSLGPNAPPAQVADEVRKLQSSKQQALGNLADTIKTQYNLQKLNTTQTYSQLGAQVLPQMAQYTGLAQSAAAGYAASLAQVKSTLMSAFQSAQQEYETNRGQLGLFLAQLQSQGNLAGAAYLRNMDTSVVPLAPLIATAVGVQKSMATQVDTSIQNNSNYDTYQGTNSSSTGAQGGQTTGGVVSSEPGGVPIQRSNAGGTNTGNQGVNVNQLLNQQTGLGNQVQGTQSVNTNAYGY